MASVHPSRSLGEAHALRLVERELVCAVLGDTIDQLAVLGGILPNYATSTAAVEHVLGSELLGILESQRQLDTTFEELSSEREPLGGQAKELTSATQAAHSARAVSENMQKLQLERVFAQEVVEGLEEEVASHGTFSSLSSSLHDHWEEREAMERAILEEEECRRRVRELRRKLADVRRSRETELGELSEEIAHLKDQLQELKAKTGLEVKYTDKEAQAEVEVVQERLGSSGVAMETTRRQLTQQLQEEQEASQHIMTYLDRHYNDLGSQLDHWMTKHEEDTDMKSRDLHDLKQNKANVLQRLEEQTKLYKEFEQVVVEHRLEKERQRQREEQEEKERWAAVKMQAGWRGVMVRKGLGPFAKGKKKGKKKGKGKGKGKKGKAKGKKGGKKGKKKKT